ncbi:OTU domain-containing protein 6B [Armadillidium vulgare]|nr:OTU domain-containing protein 6B [Armadillidium vulgare]
MSDDDENLSCREKLIKRHKLEAKELQGKILQLKKSVNKDKKRKKMVQEEILKLENDLKERHALELSQLETEELLFHSFEVKTNCDILLYCCWNHLKDFILKQGPAPPTQEMNSLNIDEANSNLIENEEELTNDDNNHEKKISKAEKRRQKKAEAAKERELLIKEAEKANKFCARNVEAGKIKAILKEKKLQMFEINPDGNCLYAALAHQLNSEDYSISSLRSKTASYIRSKLDDFMPFITDPETGDLLDQTQLEKYCDEIENTSSWGGQPELRALSQVLKRRIEVLQAEGSPIIFGEEFLSENGLILAYYRHYYGLGEHYNSVEPWVEEVDENT